MQDNFSYMISDIEVPVQNRECTGFLPKISQYTMAGGFSAYSIYELVPYMLAVALICLVYAIEISGLLVASINT